MKMISGYFLTELDYNNIRDAVHQLRDMIGDSSLDEDVLDELMEVVESASPIVVGYETENTEH